MNLLSRRWIALFDWIRRVGVLVLLLSGAFLFLLGVFLVVMFSENPAWAFELFGEYDKAEVLKFVGIGMGGILFVLQVLASHRRAKAMEDAANQQAKAAWNTEQGQRQERLKNAIEHLGHNSDSVRLGGAYELFHLAEDNPELCLTVLDILCAHIRRTTSENEYREMQKSKPSEEVQSLLTLMFVQEHGVFTNLPVNLQGSWLNGAELSGADLRLADLSEAHLRGVMLSEAHLQGALFFRAQMQGAYLVRAELDGASLYEVQLEGGNLGRARLPGADLFEAKLQGVNLAEVPLQGAILGGAQLQGANLRETQLRGVRCQEDIADSFAQRMRQSIDQESDLSWVIFGGGLSRDLVDSIAESLSDEDARKRLREELEPHIGRRISRKLPKNSGAITGTYTEEEAEEWIAEYVDAIPEGPEDDS